MLGTPTGPKSPDVLDAQRRMSMQASAPKKGGKRPLLMALEGGVAEKASTAQTILGGG